MARAWQIVDWLGHYEVNKDSRVWTEGQAMRPGPLDYVRWKALGLLISPQFADLQEEAGPLLTAPALGLFGKMLEVAASWPGGRRGWILGRKEVTMGPAAMARRWGFDPGQTRAALAALERAGWVELVECDFAVDCGQAVSCEDRQGDEGVGKDGPADSAVSAAASEPNQTKPKAREIKAKAAPLTAGGAGGGSGEEGKEMVGSAGPAASVWPTGGLEVGPGRVGVGPGEVGSLEVGVMVGLRACRGAKGPIAPGGAYDGGPGRQEVLEGITWEAWRDGLLRAGVDRANPGEWLFLGRNDPAEGGFEEEVIKRAGAWLAAIWDRPEWDFQGDQRQARRSRGRILGSNGDAGMLGRILEHSGHGGLADAIQLAQASRRKAVFDRSPLRNPVGYWCSKAAVLAGEG